MRRLPCLGILLFLAACAASDGSRSAQTPGPRLSVPSLPAVNAPAAWTPTSSDVTPVATSAPGLANLDPEDDREVGPPDVVEDCAARLEAANVRSREARLPLRSASAGYTCGSPQAVVYESGPTGVRWNAAPVGTCNLALGLARFEQIVQDEAQRELGQRVARIIQGGTYTCRKMTRFKLVSEHSYGNAIDIRGFTLENGRTLSVKRHFGKLDADATTAESRFLRAIARRAFDENVFSVVLTPYWDALHADHFHLDQARYRVDASRRR